MTSILSLHFTPLSRTCPPPLFTFDFFPLKLLLPGRSFTPWRRKVAPLRCLRLGSFLNSFISPGNHTFSSFPSSVLLLLLFSSFERYKPQRESWCNTEVLCSPEEKCRIEKGQTLFYYWHNPKSLCLWSQINFLHLILLLKAGLRAKDTWSYKEKQKERKTRSETHKHQSSLLPTLADKTCI